MGSEESFGWSGRPPHRGHGKAWTAMGGGPGFGGPGPRFGGGGPGFGGPGPRFGGGGPGFGGAEFEDGSEGGGRGWGGARFAGGPAFGPGFRFDGPPGRFGPGRGPGGRGGRARRGDVRAAVLLLLGEEPRNGYQIIQELTERSRGAWRPSPGSVYPVLQQLEDEGLVVSTTADVGRSYQITEAGTAYIEAHRSELGRPWEDAANAVGQPAIEFARLIHQVMGAMKQVLHAGSDRQVTQAAAVLADTRRALYRIMAEDDGVPSGTTRQAASGGAATGARGGAGAGAGAPGDDDEGEDA